MSTTEVLLLGQSLKILIEDFQSFKKGVYSVILGSVAFLFSTVVAIGITLISK